MSADTRLVRFRDVVNIRIVSALPSSANKNCSCARSVSICPQVVDEFHYVLQCSNFVTERKNLIPKYFFTRPNALKLSSLFNKKKPETIRKLCKLIDIVNNNLIARSKHVYKLSSDVTIHFSTLALISLKLLHNTINIKPRVVVNKYTCSSNICKYIYVLIHQFKRT